MAQPATRATALTLAGAAALPREPFRGALAPTFSIGCPQRCPAATTRPCGTISNPERTRRAGHCGGHPTPPRLPPPPGGTSGDLHLTCAAVRGAHGGSERRDEAPFRGRRRFDRGEEAADDHGGGGVGDARGGRRRCRESGRQQCQRQGGDHKAPDRGWNATAPAANNVSLFGDYESLVAASRAG